jgi:hypothetical protein
MSFANRFKAKLGGGEVRVAPETVVVAAAAAEAAPFLPRTAVAQNENGFIPTKFGEDIPDAKRTYLPRAAAGAAAGAQAQKPVNVDDMLMFPSLCSTVVAPVAAAPKKMGWAEKAKEWAADDAQKKADAGAAEDEYSW